MPERILFTASLDDKNSPRLAIDVACGICEQKKCDLVICTPYRDSMCFSLEGIYLDEAMGRLFSRKPVVQGKVKVSVESLRTLKKFGQPRVIVALEHRVSDMPKIDAIPCDMIVYVPGTPSDYEQWRSQWNPELIPSGFSVSDKEFRAMLRKVLRVRKS
jgi:hypothetical protein